MTDARASRYDELYPALDGLSGNSSSNRVNSSTSLANNNNNNNTSTNNNNAANSWSAHTASGHQQQNKLNYIQFLSHLQQHQSNNSPQPQQPQQQQQPQLNPEQQPQQQQVLNHLVADNNPSGSINQHQTQHQQFVANNNSLINNSIMQNSTFQPQQPQVQTAPAQQQQPPLQQPQQQQQQQQTRRQGQSNHPILSERFCTFKIAPEERRHRDLEQAKILKDIMNKTHTKIEVTTTKDGALNFCIIGKKDNLPVARDLVLNDFQTGVTLTVSVPKAIHGRLLGPKGARLASIQDETQTQITIPRKDEDSDVIKIVGLKSNAESAVRAIEKCAREFAGKTVEKVSVERNYLLFITGPFNENLKRWEDMGAKVSSSGGLLPSNSDRDSNHADEVTFTIIGEVNAVNQVKDEISRIYEDKKKKCTTVNIEVKKAQHKYILGHLGHNLRQLFERTGVSVELPHESESETITLRGERSKLGPALSELYTQAHSETDDFFECESWLHKYLIGPRKTHYLDFKALGVDVKSQDDKIKLHGPPTEIENIIELFEKELQQLKKNIIRKDINVEARIHGYIIGRSGGTVEQIREESGANVIVPKNDEPSELITLEGTNEAVAIAEEKINAIAKRYEASRKLVIDQQLHGSIIGRGGEKIRSIREKFSQVVFTFPELGSKHNEITIVGPSEEVEECFKYLNELHQQIQENNHQVQVPIKKDVIKYLDEAKQAIKRIKLDHKVKIGLFVNEASPATISDVKKNVRENKDSFTKEAEVKDHARKKGLKSEGKPGKGSGQQQNGVSADKGPTDQQSKVKSTGPASDTNNSGNQENYAVIIGKKENVEAAKPKFVKLLEEVATITEVEMKMSQSLREQLGPKSRLYRQFCDEFQNKVNVIFPPAQRQQNTKQQVVPATATGASGDEPTPEVNGTTGKAKSKSSKKLTNSKADQENQVDNDATETIKIRGPKNILKKAEKRFEALIGECQKNYTVRLNIDASVYDKFVYTDKLELKAIRDTLSVKLHVPDKREGMKPLVCTIVGFEKDVHQAQKQFEKLMTEVAERVEDTIEIPHQVHPRLIGAQGRAVKKLMDDFKVSVKFARSGDLNPNAVTLYGRQQSINNAKNHMQKVANQFMNMIQKNTTDASAATNENELPSNDDNNVDINNDNSQQKPQETAVAE